MIPIIEITSLIFIIILLGMYHYLLFIDLKKLTLGSAIMHSFIHGTNEKLLFPRHYSASYVVCHQKSHSRSKRKTVCSHHFLFLHI